MNVKLKRLLLPLLRGYLEGRPRTYRTLDAARQAIFLLGKATSKSKGGRLRRIQKRTAKNDETERIYAEISKRADGWCECGCSRVLQLEMDHFFGRVGPQSAATCWMLARECHRNKTANVPSVTEWNTRFEEHCNKHGYPFRPRITHAQLKRSAP